MSKIRQDAIDELKSIIMFHQVLSKDERCSDEKKQEMIKVNAVVQEAIDKLKADGEEGLS